MYYRSKKTMSKFKFKISHFDNKTKAKVGEIQTSHGVIKTPAFVPVASLASIKSLTADELKACKIDAFFVNTYHMIFRPGVDKVKKLGGLHNFMNFKGPIMTDSGGFQVFSLSAQGPRSKAVKKENLIKITDDGIRFKSIWDGKEVFLGPKEAITAQQNLGSTIMMAFDECTFYPITKKRARKAMERTHKWAKICLKVKQANHQAIYGIVQGSVFKDLRVQSAEFISSCNFDGYAIGSVANSREPRKKVFAVLNWSLPILLPKKKPIHFLGIGEIEDMFISIAKGIDSFDCVIPTRLGRMGWIFNKKAGARNKFRYDITKSSYSLDKNPPEKGCQCYTCKNYTRAYLNHLFRSAELLAYRLASYHNLYFYGNLMEQIREAIAENRAQKLQREWLKL